jgi:hypothetical protein
MNRSAGLLRLHCAVLIAIAIALCGHAMAATLYVLGQAAAGNSVNATTSFGSIDTVTGQYTTISSALLSGTTVKNLALDPVTQTFYVSSGIGGNPALRTLTTSGSISASLGAIGKDVPAMWYNAATGTLTSFTRTAPQQVGTISTSTAGFSAGATLTGGTFGNFTGGRGAALTGVNYLVAPNSTAANSAFGSIDLATGVFTPVATGSSFQTMVIASDGFNLYGLVPLTTGSSILYSINTSNGALTKLVDVTPVAGNLPIQYSGASFAVVPEPSTIALAVTGLAVLVGMRSSRRKKKSSAGI